MRLEKQESNCAQCGEIFWHYPTVEGPHAFGYCSTYCQKGLGDDASEAFGILGADYYDIDN